MPISPSYSIPVGALARAISILQEMSPRAVAVKSIPRTRIASISNRTIVLM